MKLRILQNLASLVVLLACAPAQAAWPSEPIRIVVGAAPGGPTDMVARLVGERMARNLNASVVVENRGGGGGVIAANYVAKAPPDGYTLLMGTVSTHGINPTLYRKLDYDAVKDFTPITELVSYPLVLLVNPQKVPATTMTEFLDYARKHPKGLTRASAGNGTSMHIAGEVFNSTAGTEMIHVPYKGSAPAVMSLLGGQTDVDFESINVSLPHIKSGKVIALGVTSTKPIAVLPGVPPIADSLPSFEFNGWLGLVAPAGTPQPIVERLRTAAVEALNDPEVKRKLEAEAMVPVGSTPQAFGDFIKDQIKMLGAAVKKSGATVD